MDRKHVYVLSRTESLIDFLVLRKDLAACGASGFRWAHVAMGDELQAKECHAISRPSGCNFVHEAVVSEQAWRGIKYLRKKDAANEKRVKVIEGLNRGMPRLLLLNVDLKAVTARIEMYLPNVNVCGFIVALDDLEVTAFSMKPSYHGN